MEMKNNINGGHDPDHDRDISISPSSSPPTPPSPLPISYGPGNQKYSFSPSPSPSPPFSPPNSSRTSAENLPLLHKTTLPASTTTTSTKVLSTFSLDRRDPDRPDYDYGLESNRSCLKDLLEWFIQRCCNCCTRYP